MTLTTFKSRCFAACLLLLLATGTGFCQDLTFANQQTNRPINMLVLGDSILWGQGLKPEHKSWYQVKAWIEKNTGRKVLERIEAHSGAVIEGVSTTDKITTTNSEVNLGLPTINGQLDSALRFYPDRSAVDLVLVTGCGNDVGIENLLNASAVEEVAERTKAKCGSPMEKLLRRIVGAFPAAEVVVTGYYPFFSEQTNNDFVMKALARRFFKTQPGSPKLSSKELFERLKINSRQWHEVSSEALGEAVRKANTESGQRTNRITFATIDFPAEYAFAARETRLWGVNRSPFRMMLVILSLGKILLPPNDELRKQRTAGCNQVFREQANETPQQRRERKGRRLFCRYAALGHPNRQGAVLFTNAITRILQSAFLPAMQSRHIVSEK